MTPIDSLLALHSYCGGYSGTLVRIRVLIYRYILVWYTGIPGTTYTSIRRTILIIQICNNDARNAAIIHHHHPPVRRTTRRVPVYLVPFYNLITFWLDYYPDTLRRTGIKVFSVFEYIPGIPGILKFILTSYDDERADVNLLNTHYIRRILIYGIQYVVGVEKIYWYSQDKKYCKSQNSKVV